MLASTLRRWTERSFTASCRWTERPGFACGRSLKVHPVLSVHALWSAESPFVHAVESSFTRSSVYPAVDNRWSPIITISTIETRRFTFPVINLPFSTSARPRVGRIYIVKSSIFYRGGSIAQSHSLTAALID